MKLGGSLTFAVPQLNDWFESQFAQLDVAPPDGSGFLNRYSGAFMRNGLKVCRMDTRTPEQRRKIMQSVKSKDTGPEMLVRRILHRLGYRFRLHRKDLPGRPDIVLPRHRKVILVHGCFWHAHGCAKGRPPKSRKDYWLPKLQENVRRDRTKLEHLEALGWQVMVVWQCETKDVEVLAARLKDFVRKV